MPDFDRLVRAYRWMEYLSFGPALMRTRIAFLAKVAGCRDALIFGDGDGRFTARLLGTNPAIRIDAIDASPAMLRALVRRAGRNAPRVHTEVVDARAWHPAKSEPYDLIVSHFFLDCLTTAEIQPLAAKIRAASAPDALWIISEFAVPRSWFGRVVAGPVVTALYFTFGLLTGLRIRSLPDHAGALATAGFRLVARRTSLAGLLTSELWTAG
ncbi:MAG TPA: class I SAM-dependent methyltransferase [Terracidiphilus sp.]|nr:class I SAM-dependent methyltransferase [Terracidiphilus sp.]